MPKVEGNSSAARDELAYYKSQYEQLEAELADFQSSSRELEAEMERDIEASEKREGELREKLDNMRYEVDEWKVRIYLYPHPLAYPKRTHIVGELIDCKDQT